MKSAKQLEDEVRELLEYSKWRGAGPHGKTLSAVMKRVVILRKRAAAHEKVPVKVQPLRVVAKP